MEAAYIFTSLVAAGARTLLFCRARSLAELLLQYSHEQLKKFPQTRKLVSRIRSYRGG